MHCAHNTKKILCLMLLVVQGFSAQHTLENIANGESVKVPHMYPGVAEIASDCQMMTLTEARHYVNSMAEGFFEGKSSDCREVWTKRWKYTIDEVIFSVVTASQGRVCAKEFATIADVCVLLHLADIGDPERESCPDVLAEALHEVAFLWQNVREKSVFLVDAASDMDEVLLSAWAQEKCMMVLPRSLYDIPASTTFLNTFIDNLKRAYWFCKGVNGLNHVYPGLHKRFMEGIVRGVNASSCVQERAKRAFIAHEVVQNLWSMQVDEESEGLWGDKFMSLLKQQSFTWLTAEHDLSYVPLIVKKLFSNKEDISCSIDGLFQDMRCDFSGVNALLEERKEKKKEEELAVEMDIMESNPLPFYNLYTWQVYKFFGPVCACDPEALQLPETIERALQRAKQDVDGAMTIQQAAGFLEGCAQKLCGKYQHRLAPWCRDVPTIKGWVKEFLPKNANPNEEALVQICLYLYMADIENAKCYLSLPVPSQELLEYLGLAITSYMRCKDQCRFVVREERAVDLLGEGAVEKGVFSFGAPNSLFYYLEQLEALRRGEALVFLPRSLYIHNGDIGIFVDSMHRDFRRAAKANMDSAFLDSVQANLYSAFLDQVRLGIKDHWREEGVQRTAVAYVFANSTKLFKAGIIAANMLGDRSWIDKFSSSISIPPQTYIETLKDYNLRELAAKFAGEALQNVGDIDQDMRQKEIALMLQSDWGLEDPVTASLESFIALTKCVVHKICDCNGIQGARDEFLILLENGMRAEEKKSKSFGPGEGNLVLQKCVSQCRSGIDLYGIRDVYLSETIENMSPMERQALLQHWRDLYKVKMQDSCKQELFSVLGQSR